MLCIILIAGAGNGTKTRCSSPSHPMWNGNIQSCIQQPFTFETGKESKNKLLTNGGIVNCPSSRVHRDIMQASTHTFFGAVSI